MPLPSVTVVINQVFLQVVQQEYTAKDATIGPDLPVEFESEHISLELPSENKILNGGWRMLPLFHPRVREFQSLYVQYGLPLVIELTVSTDYQGASGQFQAQTANPFLPADSRVDKAEQAITTHPSSGTQGCQGTLQLFPHCT